MELQDGNIKAVFLPNNVTSIVLNSGSSPMEILPRAMRCLPRIFEILFSMNKKCIPPPPPPRTAKIHPREECLNSILTDGSRHFGNTKKALLLEVTIDND